jgi:hypothetical protein
MYDPKPSGKLYPDPKKIIPGSTTLVKREGNAFIVYTNIVHRNIEFFFVSFVGVGKTKTRIVIEIKRGEVRIVCMTVTKASLQSSYKLHQPLQYCNRPPKVRPP